MFSSFPSRLSSGFFKENNEAFRGQVLARQISFSDFAHLRKLPRLRYTLRVSLMRAVHTAAERYSGKLLRRCIRTPLSLYGSRSLERIVLAVRLYPFPGRLHVRGHYASGERVAIHPARSFSAVSCGALANGLYKTLSWEFPASRKSQSSLSVARARVSASTAVCFGWSRGAQSKLGTAIRTSCVYIYICAESKQAH